MTSVPPNSWHPCFYLPWKAFLSRERPRLRFTQSRVPCKRSKHLHFLSLVTPVAHLPTPSHSSNGFFESLPHTEPPKTSGFPLNRLRNDGHTAHRSEIEAAEHPFYDVMCYSTLGSFSFGGYMVLTCFWKNFIMSFASPVS